MTSPFLFIEIIQASPDPLNGVDFWPAINIFFLNGLSIDIKDYKQPRALSTPKLSGRFFNLTS